MNTATRQSNKTSKHQKSWLVYIVFMPLSIIFQLYRGGQIYWWKKPAYPGKTTDLRNTNKYDVQNIKGKN
jgi:hypothetical protein